MLSKRSLVVILVGVNLLLLGLLLLGSFSLPSVLAQMSARPGDFACVTAKAAGQSYHTLFIVDVPKRTLHAFYPVDGHTNDLVAAAPRDLAKDFDRPK